MPSGNAPVLTSLSASWLLDGACSVTSDRPVAAKSPADFARYSEAWSGLGNQSSRTVGFAGLGATAPVVADELPDGAAAELDDELAAELQPATASASAAVTLADIRPTPTDRRQRRRGAIASWSFIRNAASTLRPLGQGNAAPSLLLHSLSCLQV